MFNTFGKLYEVESKGNWMKEASERQFGFRRGRSTVGVVEMVKRGVRKCREQCCVLVVIDI